MSKQTVAAKCYALKTKVGTFLLGGWAGVSEGRVISKIFTNWGGPNLFCLQPGEGHTFLGREKLLFVTSIKVGSFFLLTNMQSLLKTKVCM